MSGRKTSLGRRPLLRTTLGFLGLVGLGGEATGTVAASTLTVTTSDPQSVSHCSAALWGSLDDMGGAASVDVTYEWREEGASTWNTTRTETVETTASIRHYLDGLASGTTYEYRLTATASDGDTATGSTKTVTTDSSPSLKGDTDAATDVMDTSAVLNGTLDELGDVDSADVLFRWGPEAPSGGFPPNTTLETTLSSEGSYSEEITDLDPDTTYEYWLAIDSGYDVHRGSRIAFTTASPLLKVSTGLVTDISDTGATIHGELEGLGDADSADVNFEWRQTGASSWNATSAQTLTSPDTFDATLDGLTEETEYEYRAVAAASDGDTDTGKIETFTTTGDPSVTTEEAFNIEDTSASVEGVLHSDGGADSFDVFFEWGENGDLSNTATDITWDSVNFNHFFADLTGLAPTTTYDFRAVVEASDGDTDVGSVRSFTTKGAPVIDSFSVTTADKNDPHAEITADWTVSDVDGNLDTVTVEVIDGGSVIDSATTDVSGDSASGSDVFNINQGGNTTYDVRLTVTDADGLTDSQTKTVTAA